MFYDQCSMLVLMFNKALDQAQCVLYKSIVYFNKRSLSE